jgi:Sec-independent protein translocase protein TatA
MKRLSFILAIGLLAGLCTLCPAWAEVSKDERNLEREAKRLNDTAAKPDGEKAVIKRLTAEFKATDQQVQDLRGRNLSYGDAAIVLSLAQTLTGGVTDANVQKVLALRQGPPVMGWGEVAQQLGTKLGKTVSQVRKAANNANRDIKNDHARAGKAPKQAPVEQKQQEQKNPAPPHSDQGDGRMLRHGTSAQ